MLTIEGSASLNLVKEQIDESLGIAESNLEQYVEEPDNDSRLKASIEQFAQIKGVFKLINLPGAALLSEELEQLGLRILNRRQKNNERELATISGAIMLLVHYLEYVEIKKRALPVLLIPTINEVRSLLDKSLITESIFFDVQDNPPRPPKPGAAEPDLQQIDQTGRRLRHMYQVGMLGIFRQINISTNAKLMGRALERLDSLAGNTPMAKLLWLALGVVEAIGHERVELSTPRKSLLGMIDRQIKQMVFQSASTLQKEPPFSLVKECVYIAYLAGPVTDTLKSIISHYNLDTGGMTDEALRNERDIMRGPGGSVIRSVAEALNEELTHIKDALDLGARGASADGEGFDNTADAMLKVANTLIMLGLSKPAGLFKEQANIVRGWSAGNVDGDSEEFNKVADALLYVENSIATLAPRRGPDAGNFEQKAEDVINSGMSVMQLDDARRVVVAEARAGLSLAKRAITSFMDSNWDGMHLTNVPVTLRSVWGGLIFLQLPRAAEVVRVCEQFIEQKLIRDRADKPSNSTMETLADAITSIDYFLEGMEDNKPIGDGVLDVAEDSMRELGFPVQAV
ncbi:MAG: hypothetical protein R3F47_13560 [Gammaproteobacteria bacterium]